MSRKYEEIRRIAVNAIRCWTVSDGEGTVLSLDDIIGRCRKESVQIARTLAVCQILSSGFPVSDIADFLDRTPQAIRDMRSRGNDLLETSRAFRIAYHEATDMNRQTEPSNMGAN